MSPADKWKVLSQASRASTEALAKAIKERRLRRSPGYDSSRQSEESVGRRDRKPTTPEWKRQLATKRHGDLQKPARLSPEKTSFFERSPQTSKTPSPTKSEFYWGSRPSSQRSGSRPVNGAVKAMAALFDHASKDFPVSPATVLTRKTRHDSNAPSGLLSPYYGSNSPTKSTRTNGSPAFSTPRRIYDDSKPVETPTRNKEPTFSAHRSNLSPTPARVTPEHTPTKFPQVSLRPTGHGFTSPRKVPASPSTKQIPGRDRELAGLPSLGTMGPQPEEPPVAQHIVFPRRPSGTPQASNDESDERGSTFESPRIGSGNSMLHTQIRLLQKRLDVKGEENARLRRQLEAREKMDVGRLCEQLREARRECKTWRERAEAAERRVAAFEQFTARVRGLRDAVTQDTGLVSAGDEQVDGPSRYGGGQSDTSDGMVFMTSSSEHTENQDDLRERIRKSLRRQAVISCSNGLQFEEGDAGGSDEETRMVLWNKRAAENRITQLWDMAEEYLVLDADIQREG